MPQNSHPGGGREDCGVRSTLQSGRERGKKPPPYPPPDFFGTATSLNTSIGALGAQGCEAFFLRKNGPQARP